MELTLTSYGTGKEIWTDVRGTLTWGEYKKMFGIERIQDSDMVAVTMQESGLLALDPPKICRWPRQDPPYTEE